ncbi:peptidase inhibitor family I36 protein [Micromonospora sp. WMMD710]|uniref:peptidase inhibitor family I36 protein n=1 Tax=Micromonospora sp. WMMD710 TaxID=3016085 RepID=UPI0024179D6D|nr:peptidase inhibitor family I36 protein [Micromonospora sp. WMMD710]MDG4758649.1 peptidase inhibitor family I36 protein [Micromonospora sp. WMMD710]
MLATGAALAVASPAAAATPACEANTICLWEHKNWEGQKVSLPRCTPSLGGFDNKASSFYNNTGLYLRLYENNDYSGRYIEIPAGFSYWNLHDRKFTVRHANGELFASPGEFNDVTSSVC